MTCCPHGRTTLSCPQCLQAMIAERDERIAELEGENMILRRTAKKTFVMTSSGSDERGQLNESR